MAQPAVELTFEPSELTGLQTTGRLLGTPQEAMTAALHQTRTQMMSEMKERLEHPGLVTATTVANLADHSWELVKPSWMRVSVPVLAEAYLRAYRKADAGDISREAVYALARRHAADLGDYYNETSKDAMVEGFNGFVNRRVAARAAANQVAEAYGMTPRQMRAYIAARLQWNRSISSFTSQGLKKEAAKFIVRSLFQRYKNISEQELHKVGEEGKQLAWMYLLEKGDLPSHAEKMWLTAKDERVCPICGPLHNTRIPITEKFQTDVGEFWSPGIHPNCRCELRLLPHEFRDVNDVQKDLRGGEIYDFNRKHPRGHSGQFRRTATTTLDPDDEFNRIITAEREMRPAPTALERAQDTKKDTELERKYMEIVQMLQKPSRTMVVPAPAKPRVQPTVKMPPTVTVARPTVAVAKPKVVTVKPKVEVAEPEVKVATKPKVRAPAKPKTKTKVEAVAPPSGKLKNPLYASVRGTHFEGKGVEMHPQMKLHQDPRLARDEAAKQVEAAIRFHVNRITRQKMKHPFEIGGIKVEPGWEPKPHVGKARGRAGEKFPQYWDMSHDQVEEMVRWYAQQAVAENLGKDYRYSREPAVPIVAPEEPEFTNFWRDEHGNKVEAKPSTFFASDLGKEMGLKPSLFDWRVVEINEATQEPMDVEDVKEHLPEGPWVSGQYRATPGSMESSDERTPVTYMKIQPEKPKKND